MLVSAPSAFHHCGQQLRFLPVGGKKIFPRKLILRLSLQAAFTVRNEIVDCGQILPQRGIHGRSARELYVHKPMFLFRQGARRFRIRTLRIRILDGGPPDLKNSRGDDQQTNSGGGQGAATKKFGNAMPPGKTPDVSSGGRLDDAFRFKLRAEGNPYAGGRLDFRGHSVRRSNNLPQVRDDTLASGAGNEVSACGRGQRRNPFLFEDKF